MINRLANRTLFNHSKRAFSGATSVVPVPAEQPVEASTEKRRRQSTLWEISEMKTKL